MNNLTPSDIYGINPIVALPFTEQGDVDYKSFDSLLNHLAQTGCHGLTLFGIASEFYKLSEQEKQKLAELFLRHPACKQQYRCLSVTEHATELAVKRAVDYQKLGADCLMLLPPFFLGPSDEQLLEHIEQVLNAVDIPVMVQYAPNETGRTIPAQQLAELAQKHPNMLFKIECLPPVDYSKALLRVQPDATILNGYAGLYMPEMLQAGAKGIMPGCSFTEIYLEIYRLIEKGEHYEANQLHQALLEYIRPWMSHCETIIQIEKTILRERGIIESDYCRRPTHSSTTEDKAQTNRFLNQFSRFFNANSNT